MRGTAEQFVAILGTSSLISVLVSERDVVIIGSLQAPKWCASSATYVDSTVNQHPSVYFVPKSTRTSLH